MATLRPSVLESEQAEENAMRQAAPTELDAHSSAGRETKRQLPVDFVRCRDVLAPLGAVVLWLRAVLDRRIYCALKSRPCFRLEIELGWQCRILRALHLISPRESNVRSISQPIWRIVAPSAPITSIGRSSRKTAMNGARLLKSL